MSLSKRLHKIFFIFLVAKRRDFFSFARRWSTLSISNTKYILIFIFLPLHPREKDKQLSTKHYIEKIEPQEPH
jgi:hypothetical protein